MPRFGCCDDRAAAVPMLIPCATTEPTCPTPALQKKTDVHNPSDGQQLSTLLGKKPRLLPRDCRAFKISCKQSTVVATAQLPV